MSIKPVTFYVAECDLCGYRDDVGDYAAWGTEQFADEYIVDSGWFSQGGNHLCVDCLDDLTTPPSDDDEH